LAVCGGGVALDRRGKTLTMSGWLAGYKRNCWVDCSRKMVTPNPKILSQFVLEIYEKFNLLYDIISPHSCCLGVGPFCPLEYLWKYFWRNGAINL